MYLKNTSCKQHIKDKIKTYCIKCRKDTENIDQKWLEPKITD